MNAVAVKTANVILAVLTQLPLLEGSFVAVLANFRGNGQGHWSVFLGVPLAHDAMTGFTGDARVRVGAGLDIRSGGVTYETGETAIDTFPGLLEALGEGPRMWGVLPLVILFFVTTTTLLGACEIVRLGGGYSNNQGK